MCPHIGRFPARGDDSVDGPGRVRRLLRPTRRPVRAAAGGPPAAAVSIVTLAAEADRADVGLHRDRPIAALDDDSAAGRRARHEDLREVGRSGPRRRAARADRSREAGRDRAKLGVQRAAREADVTYWKAQVERLKSLLEAGAISQNEFDQAQHELDSAQANLGRAQRAGAREPGAAPVLPRHRPDEREPSATCRFGKAIASTTSTMITTIDDRSGLEAYIQVPLDRAPELRLGLPVQILDRQDHVVVTNPITFVAPRVDDATQTVLAKTLLRNVPPGHESSSS